MGAVVIIWLLIYTLSSHAYPNPAQLTARYSYKQPNNNHLIKSYDVQSIKNAARMHRECKKQQQQIKHLSQYAGHQALEHYFIHNHDTYNRQDRLDALHQTDRSGGKKIKRIIPVDEKIYAYAREYEIPKSAFTQRAMHEYEHQLHKEFIEQLTQAHELKPLYNQAREHIVFLDIVGHSIAFGMEANEKNLAATATYWCDIAWKSLDLAQAVGEGIALGLYNTAALVSTIASWSANVVTHPWESYKTVIHGIKKVISAFGNGITHVTQFRNFNDPHYRMNIDQELEHVIAQMNGIINYCSDQLVQMPLREKVKYVTAFGTELIIPGKAFKMIHNICSRIKPIAVGLFHALRDEQKAVQITARVEGVAENIGMRAIEGARQAAIPAKTVLSEAQLLLHNFHADLMKKLHPEIAALRVMFDNKVKGFGEFANKYLKIDYEHIFGINLSFSKRGVPQIGGFHHDFMHAIKNSGLFEFVDEVVHTSGFYKTNLFHKGSFVKEITFFPAHWSREKVVSVVYEAYNNFITNGGAAEIQKNGTYKVTGLIKEGVEIVMFITKNGRLTTTYPVF